MHLLLKSRENFLFTITILPAQYVGLRVKAGTSNHMKSLLSHDKIIWKTKYMLKLLLQKKKREDIKKSYI
jgi:hypothetical protein